MVPSTHYHRAERDAWPLRAQRSIPGPLSELAELQRVGEVSPEREAALRQERYRFETERQMVNLRAMDLVLTDVQFTSSRWGMPKTEAALNERANWLRDLGWDGAVDPGLVQAHACALTELADACPLDARGCTSYERLREVVDAVCADPMVRLPTEILEMPSDALELGLE